MPGSFAMLLKKSIVHFAYEQYASSEKPCTSVYYDHDHPDSMRLTQMLVGIELLQEPILLLPLECKFR